MQKLQTVNAETLLYEPLEKPSFVVDSLIPTGLSLFCGSQKIGKSWLMLKLCLCVSQGLPLWDMPTMEGDVLYLCLEDTFCRIQDRLFRLTNEASRRLHFAVASCKLSDGLIVQLEDYLKDYPNSRLIVIDTLQKVRTASKDNAYASDYGDISLIKDFADRHSLAVIVVHHIRKQNDSDVFNKVSGTTGLSLFCGSQKIGKSWLMLKLCLCVSQGIPLWDMPTMEGDVLYLCLEDTFCRIQDRLFRLTDEASGRLHFAVASCKLSDGLIVQLEDYLKDYPDSRLIVIDTLQKVRTASKDNAYASDYGDISLIKDFADRHSLAVIVVHHIRKQNDSDVFNKVSGTTGLTGSADATFVLEKEKRASDTAKLYVTGRDTPYQEYTLRFRDCRWELVERKTQEQLAKETIPDVLFRLVDFMRDKEEWIGTATELLAAMGETETIPTVITKWLNEYRTTFLSENRICYQYSRRKDGRRIALARRAGDSGDGGDSDIRIPPCYCH